MTVSTTQKSEALEQSKTCELCSSFLSNKSIFELSVFLIFAPLDKKIGSLDLN
jgi:hypothetical protein